MFGLGKKRTLEQGPKPLPGEEDIDKVPPPESYPEPMPESKDDEEKINVDSEDVRSEDEQAEETYKP